MEAKNKSQEALERLGRAVLQNNHLRRELRRYLRNQHIKKVIKGGKHESRIDDKCSNLDVDILERLQRKI